MNYSFSKNLRINKVFEYDNVLKNGENKHSCFWRINFIANQIETPRLGLIISKKSHKKAYNRNLRKRLIRETFRTQQQKLKKLDMIVIAKESNKTTNKELISDLTNLFKKISNI